jgi:hypothetical protein
MNAGAGEVPGKPALRRAEPAQPQGVAPCGTQGERRFLSLIASVALGVATVAFTRDAHASDPIRIEVGAKFGGATNPSWSTWGTDPLALGVGGRAGLTFAGGFYAGGSFMYYLGTTEGVASPCTVSSYSCPELSIALHTVMVGAELGYGITLFDLLTVRPQVGVGNATVSANSSDGTSQSASFWYLEPGVTGLLVFGAIFLGADGNALLFPSVQNSWAGFSLHVQAGVRF